MATTSWIFISPAGVPFSFHCDDLYQQLTDEYNRVQKEVVDLRISTFKQRMIHDWNNSRKDSYNWLRNKDCFTTPCFQPGPN